MTNNPIKSLFFVNDILCAMYGNRNGIDMTEYKIINVWRIFHGVRNLEFINTMNFELHNLGYASSKEKIVSDLRNWNRDDFEKGDLVSSIMVFN